MLWCFVLWKHQWLSDPGGERGIAASPCLLARSRGLPCFTCTLRLNSHRDARSVPEVQRIPCFCDARYRSILICIDHRCICMCKWSNAVSSLYHRPFSLVKWLVSHGHITRGACFLFGSFGVAPSGTSSAQKQAVNSSRSSWNPSGCCGRWNWLWKNNTMSQLYPGGRLGWPCWRKYSYYLWFIMIQ